MIPFKHLLEEDLRACFDTLVSSNKSLLFDNLWTCRLQHNKISGLEPFGFRSGDVEIDSEGVLTIYYGGCSEPAFPLVSFHSENGKLTRYNKREKESLLKGTISIDLE